MSLYGREGVESVTPSEIYKKAPHPSQPYFLTPYKF
jgi:hypothetical protein